MKLTNTLVESVKKDIFDFLKGNDKLLYNERDLQMNLAMYLSARQFYDKIDLEYYIPKMVFGKKYQWENELKIDIVVSKDGKYCPVELKYKTKAVQNEPKIVRFGTELSKFGVSDSCVLKNQSAQDLGMYDFWKDVRRVELVKEYFPNVANGLCVFVTNDKHYLGKPKTTSNNLNFAMNDGIHDNKYRHWQDENSSCAKTHPGFNLSNEYEIRWNTKDIESIEFYYVILTI